MHPATALRLVYFLVFCCTGAWLPKLYDYCLYKQLSGAQSALILSITPVMMFAVQPVYGMLADRLGYKKTLLVACLAASISYLGFLYNAGFTGLVVTTIIMSLFYNTIQPVLDSMALQLAKKDNRFSYGNLRFYGAAGFAFTSLITGQFIDAVDIRAIFIVSSITMLLAFVACFFLQQQAAERTAESGYRHVWGVVKNPALLLLLVCVFLVSMGATAIWNFYSAYLKENGATDALVGYGLSFQGLCELPLFYLSARIILKLGLKTTLLLTILATVVRMLLYHVIHVPLATLPVELLHGFSWSLFWVVCVEYVSKLVNEHWLATGQSLLYAAYFGVGAIAGNYWASYFIDAGIKVSALFLLNAGLVGVALAVAAFIRNPSGKFRPTKG